MLRPIRPNPLIPTLVIWTIAPLRRGGPPRLSGDGPDVMLCGAASWFRRAGLYARVRQRLEPAKTMIDGRLRKLHATCQLAQVELGVVPPPTGHLTQRGRHPVQLAGGLETLDRRRLPETRADRLADVRGLEVEG